MKKVMMLSLVGLGLLFASSAFAAPPVHVAIGIGVGPVYGPPPIYDGPPPVCPYGYYPTYPYACAPYGYYGPQWFTNGVFIGAGPWRGYGGYYGRPYNGYRSFSYNRPYYRTYGPAYGRGGYRTFSRSGHQPASRGNGFQRGGERGRRK